MEVPYWGPEAKPRQKVLRQVPSLTSLQLHPFGGLFRGQPGQPAPERQTILDFTGARDDGV